MDHTASAEEVAFVPANYEDNASPIVRKMREIDEMLTRTSSSLSQLSDKIGPIMVPQDIRGENKSPSDPATAPPQSEVAGYLEDVVGRLGSLNIWIHEMIVRVDL